MEGIRRSIVPPGRGRAPTRESEGRDIALESGRHSKSKGPSVATTHTEPAQMDSRRKASAVQQPKSLPSREGERREHPGTPRRQSNEGRQRSPNSGTSSRQQVANVKGRSPTPGSVRQNCRFSPCYQILNVNV